MAYDTLVDLEIEDAQKLINRLSEEGTAVYAACWVKESESASWHLYLASSLVGDDGASKKGYLHINSLIRQFEEEGTIIDPLKIRLVATNKPVVNALAEIYQRYPGRTPGWFRGDKLGDLEVDEAYIYAPVGIR